MSSNAPPDQAARERIVSELDRTMLVEAAAGTGKTTCMIHRMTALLREGKCPVDKLAAVTFTRKAAAEIRSRFQAEVEHELRSGRVGRDETRRLEAARRDVHRCFIGTIHAFCGRLLRERPVEAGIDPTFLELDEAADRQLRGEAWREHVARLTALDDPILPELERLGLTLNMATKRDNSLLSELSEVGLEPLQLGSTFLKVAEYGDVECWPAEPTPMPDHRPAAEELRAYAEHLEALALPRQYGRDAMIPKCHRLLRMLRVLDTDQPAQLMEALEIFRPMKWESLTKKHWPGTKEQTREELNRWNRLNDDFAAPLLRAWREHRYEPALRALLPAREVYDRLRRERRALSFQDLLAKTARLLRDHQSVRSSFRRQFTHVVVDEFQDTDPIQAEVLLLLTSADETESDWRRCRPTPGSLFIVGDPKQSIYRFRRADILTYNRVKEIVERDGDVIALSANFRSQPPVIDWINQHFSRAFPEQATACSPANHPLEYARHASDAETPRTGVIPLQIDGLDDRDEINQVEADAIARTIQAAVGERWPLPRTDDERNRGLPPYATPGDFLIIARNRWKLSTFARKLQEFSIPHEVTGGSSLNETPELDLLHRCLKAAVRPFDPVALVAALRSELFGFADTELYEWIRAGGRFSFRSPPPDDIPPELAVRFTRSFERLHKYAGWLKTQPPAAAAERVIDDLGLAARAAAGSRGPQRAGGLLKAVELLREESLVTSSEFVDELGKLVAKSESHDGIDAYAPSERVVRIMNLHQAKGLEAPIVFLVDPSGQEDHDVELHVDRSENQPIGQLAIHGRSRSRHRARPLLAQPPGWEATASIEREFQAAENDRLMYVAATRAGALLVVSRRGVKPQKSPWHSLSRDLRDVAPLQPPIESAEPRHAPADSNLSDRKGAERAIEQRWRRAVEPTYEVHAAKSWALRGDKPHSDLESGAAWGSVIHGLLETAMKQPDADLEMLAGSLLTENGLATDGIPTAVETTRQVIQSDLWRRARSAPQRMVEASFGTLLETAEATTPLVLRGVIDLTFRELLGWVIVDYKSERVEESALAELVDFYRPQLETYARAWEQTTGEPVAERGLLFTHHGKYVEV